MSDPAQLADALQSAIPSRRPAELRPPQAWAAAIVAAWQERCAAMPDATFLERQTALEQILAETLEQWHQLSFTASVDRWLEGDPRRAVMLGREGTTREVSLEQPPDRYGGAGQTWEEAMSDALGNFDSSEW